MDLSMLAAIAGIVALPTSLLLWTMSKLHHDITVIAADSNAKWVAMNARIDTNQAIIMRMLEKQGK